MAIIQDIVSWEQNKFYPLFSYIKPLTDNGFYFLCVKAGSTGNNEPSWNIGLEKKTQDNQVIWECVRKISTEFNILDLTTEYNKNKDIFLKFSDIMSWIISIEEKTLTQIISKYSNHFELEEDYLREVLNETGFGYIADANILSTSDLANILSFLKVIHLLKGTRKGLRLVLDLLGYPYTEILWYEQIPEGEPHTFELNITFEALSYTAKTVQSLIQFLRFYVYPIAKVISDIKPFKLTTNWTTLKVLPNYTYDVNISGFIPLTSNSLLFSYFFTEGNGFVLNDETDLENNALIVPTGNNPDLLFRYLFKENTGTALNDLSNNNNNSSIVASPQNKNLLLAFNLVNNTSPIQDLSPFNNLTSIVPSLQDKKNLFELKFLQNNTLFFNDSSPNNNDFDIIPSLKPSYNLFQYSYIENTGNTINDGSGNNNNQTIIANSTNYPREENLKAFYKFNSNNGLDSSGNNKTAIINGSTFNLGKITIGNNTTDYVDVPFDVLNGLGDFTIAFKLKVLGIHNTGLNVVISGANSTQPHAFSIFINVLNWVVLLDNIGYQFFTDNSVFTDNLEHSHCFVRRNNAFEYWLDGGLFSTYTSIPTTALNIDNGGLILGQDQDSVGGSFDANQSLNSELDNVIFYNVALSENEIKKISQLA